MSSLRKRIVLLSRAYARSKQDKHMRTKTLKICFYLLVITSDEISSVGRLADAVALTVLKLLDSEVESGCSSRAGVDMFISNKETVTLSAGLDVTIELVDIWSIGKVEVVMFICVGSGPTKESKIKIQTTYCCARVNANNWQTLV